jgi:hypothetical protein
MRLIALEDFIAIEIISLWEVKQMWKIRNLIKLIILRISKSGRVKWAEHITRVEETENDDGTLIRKHRGRNRDGDGRILLKTLTKVACGDVSCIETA